MFSFGQTQTLASTGEQIASRPPTSLRKFAPHTPPPRAIRRIDIPEVDDLDVPPADSVALLPVEVSLKYTYAEPYGTAEVSYVFPGGRIFESEAGLPVAVDNLKPGVRVRLEGGNVATITAVAFSYEPPNPPIQLENGLVMSRVIGTIKHHWNTVMDVSWMGYTATGTPSHPYYSVDRQAYVPAADLRVGEMLQTDADTVTPVQSLNAPRHGLFEVFNLEVEHFHNYFVGSGGGGAVLVHNGGCITKPVELEEAGLDYFHQLKANKVTNMAELNSQIEGQVARMNAIIEAEGMAGLKQRILRYNADVDAQGRAYVKTLASPEDGMAWLHEPDMRLGGLPTDVFRQGDLRTNSILGGQANRLRQAILEMPDTTGRIVPRLTVVQPR